MAALRAFDRKFGADFVSGLPTGPGVYFIYDARDALIYVGKAKNLRRRLSQYRNARRRKKHLKMRAIVKDAARMEFELCPNHLEACLLEARLIQRHRPKWNVAGAFYFLYPMLGIAWGAGTASFCYTTEPARFAEFEFHGAYRSRLITKEAFFALMELLAYVGHPMKGRARAGAFSYVFRFRQLPREWFERWRGFLSGGSRCALEELVLALVENAGARRDRKRVQDHLESLARFWKHEALPLAQARSHSGYAPYPVAQTDRDLVFLKFRHPDQSG